MIEIEIEMGSTKGISEEAFGVLRPHLVNNMMRAVLILESSFKRVVGGPGRGRLYKRTKSGKMHRASAPGQPPARDLGDYVKSFDHAVDGGRGTGPVRGIGFVMGRVDLSDIVGRVGSRMWNTRGKLLEFGTYKMRPRPHVDQAINNARAGVERALGDV